MSPQTVLLRASLTQLIIIYVRRTRLLQSKVIKLFFVLLFIAWELQLWLNWKAKQTRYR